MIVVFVPTVLIDLTLIEDDFIVVISVEQRIVVVNLTLVFARTLIKLLGNVRVIVILSIIQES